MKCAEWHGLCVCIYTHSHAIPCQPAMPYSHASLCWCLSAHFPPKHMYPIEHIWLKHLCHCGKIFFQDWTDWTVELQTADIKTCNKIGHRLVYSFSRCFFTQGSLTYKEQTIFCCSMHKNHHSSVHLLSLLTCFTPILTLSEAVAVNSHANEEWAHRGW